MATAAITIEPGPPERVELWEFGAGIAVGVVCATWDDPRGAPEDLVAWGAEVLRQVCAFAAPGDSEFVGH